MTTRDKLTLIGMILAAIAPTLAKWSPIMGELAHIIGIAVGVGSRAVMKQQIPAALNAHPNGPCEHGCAMCMPAVLYEPPQVRVQAPLAALPVQIERRMAPPPQDRTQPYLPDQPWEPLEYQPSNQRQIAEQAEQRRKDHEQWLANCKKVVNPNPEIPCPSRKPKSKKS